LRYDAGGPLANKGTRARKLRGDQHRKFSLNRFGS